MSSVGQGKPSRQRQQSFGDDGDDDEDISIVWEIFELFLRDGYLVCWTEDNIPLDVVPLASSAPLIAMGCDEVPLAVTECEPPLTDWVMEKYQAFGVCWGFL